MRVVDIMTISATEVPTNIGIVFYTIPHQNYDRFSYSGGRQICQIMMIKSGIVVRLEWNLRDLRQYNTTLYNISDFKKYANIYHEKGDDQS